MRAVHRVIVDVPAVPFGPNHKSPRAVDADSYKLAARNIRYQMSRGNAFAGSNLTEAVARLCEAVSLALAGEDATPLVDLGLTPRTYNSLRREGVRTVGELASIPVEQLALIRGVGSGTLEEIEVKLGTMGMR